MYLDSCFRTLKVLVLLNLFFPINFWKIYLPPQFSLFLNANFSIFRIVSCKKGFFCLRFNFIPPNTFILPYYCSCPISWYSAKIEQTCEQRSKWRNLVWISLPHNFSRKSEAGIRLLWSPRFLQFTQGSHESKIFKIRILQPEHLTNSRPIMS